MPRIELDHDLCQGHAVCEDEAPEVFALDDDAKVIVKQTEIPEDNAELLEKVQTACTYCPTGAISLVNS